MSLRTRLIVVPIIVDADDRVLLCRMSADRGVFPGQWALPGGGVEAGERIEEALHREVMEELGVELATVTPLLFKDAVLEKKHTDGSLDLMHMVFLVYRCTLVSPTFRLNEEFSEASWFKRSELAKLSLSELTRQTLRQAGFQ